MDDELRKVSDPCLVNPGDPFGGMREGRRTRRGISWCGQEGCLGPRKCRECRNAYSRAWRKLGREKPVDPMKARARSLVKMRIRRGKMVRGACEVCGEPNAQAHHPDYRKPLDVRWLCLKHHREHERENPAEPLAEFIERKRVVVSDPCLSAGQGHQPGRVRREGVSYCGSPDCTGPNGSKGCRACHAAYMRSWRARRKSRG